MTQSLSPITFSSPSTYRPISLLLIVRISMWTCALVSLCFFVTEQGLRFYADFHGFSSDNLVLTIPVLWMVSLSPFLIALEALAAHRASVLRVWGLMAFVVFTLVLTTLIGLGIAASYFTYAGVRSYLPYIMLGVGLVAWLFMIGASKLLIWERET